MILKSRPKTIRFAYKVSLLLKYDANLLNLSLRHFEILSINGVIWSTESAIFRREFGKI